MPFVSKHSSWCIFLSYINQWGLALLREWGIRVQLFISPFPREDPQIKIHFQMPSRKKLE
jgi:hypothetical protein